MMKNEVKSEKEFDDSETVISLLLKSCLETNQSACVTRMFDL